MMIKMTVLVIHPFLSRALTGAPSIHRPTLIHCEAKKTAGPIFIFFNNFVEPRFVLIIEQKRQQNCPPLLIAVDTVPCETQQAAVTYKLQKS